MTSNLLTQLGQVLLQSLWQGAILALVFLILLTFIRQSRVRYALACLTLFTLLGWVVVSWVQVWGSSLTRVNPPFIASEPRQASVATSVNPDVTERPKQRLLEPSQPPREKGEPSVTAVVQPQTRAATFNVELQKVLPYISLAWMVGVAALSLRLLASFYLLRRYRKQSFELMEPWITERVQRLAQRLKLRQHITLLQTDTLAVPAVMGLLKPLVLLPTSIVSGLSVGQLELLLAHELAHIKRRDYLVNILQTLAETLLFYHPVVWWVSKVIRQEREHCCDDVALQVTGQSAVEYADVLLRLEKSRQGLALAASSGSLMRRVERLLNPYYFNNELRSGFACFIVVALLSFTFAFGVVRAQLVQISQTPFVLNADIAIDPVNPSRIAVTLNKAAKANCSRYLCSYDAVLYISTDEGKTWRSQPVYKNLASTIDWRPTFDNEGTLYTIGSIPDLDTLLLEKANKEMQITSESRIRFGNDIYNPTLAIDEKTGNFYLASLGYQMMGEFFAAGVPEIRMSYDKGASWTQPMPITQEKFWKLTGGYAVQADVLIGQDNEFAVVWLQNDNEIIITALDDDMAMVSVEDTKPYSIWVSSSTDNGETFSKPEKIGTTWTTFDTAFSNGSYYVAFTEILDDTQNLMLMSSVDNGLSWSSSPISRNLPVYPGLPLNSTPSLDVSPNGIVDVIFYSPIDACALPPELVINQISNWTDECSYNIYYAYSSDGGTKFSNTRQLNEEPILGSQFLRIAGQTKPGYIGIASTNEAAYPVWIGNREGVEGTQAYMLQIKR